MWETTYWNLLIFGCILFQGILGSSLEDNLKDSSNLHLRTKRAVGHTLRGHGDWMITDLVHIVKICLGNEQICTGVIVTPKHILVPAACIAEVTTMYTVQSGVPDRGIMLTHHISYIFSCESLYLLLLHRGIPLESRFSKPILPAEEPLPIGIHPTIIAFNSIGQLRIIQHVQIMQITETHVITVPSHLAHRSFFDMDRGAALVVGDRLFAVLVQPGEFTHGFPDLFKLVNNHNEYYEILMQHIQPYLHSHPQLYNPAR